MTRVIGASAAMMGEGRSEAAAARTGRIFMAPYDPIRQDPQLNWTRYGGIFMFRSRAQPCRARMNHDRRAHGQRLAQYRAPSGTEGGESVQDTRLQYGGRR